VAWPGGKRKAQSAVRREHCSTIQGTRRRVSRRQKMRQVLTHDPYRDVPGTWDRLVERLLTGTKGKPATQD
jgi:hypothetical protein